MPNLNWHIFVFNFFKMLAQNQVKQSHKWSLSMELINLSLPVIAKCLFEWPCPVISCCDNHTNSIKAVVMVCIVLNICKLYCTPQQPEVIVLKKKKTVPNVFFFHLLLLLFFVFVIFLIPQPHLQWLCYQGSQAKGWSNHNFSTGLGRNNEVTKLQLPW